nr:type II toxin-antitoxin system HipA family toxin [Azospirillum sp. SYSU D00513]
MNVLLGGVKIGEVRKNVSAGGSLNFFYEAAWVGHDQAVPLSLSMPLTSLEHGNGRILPFMKGLLPDNDDILASMGRQFGVSGNSPFALLERIGRDCAGAVQFVTDADLPELGQDGPVLWLSDDEVGQRLAELRRGMTSGRRYRDPGQFSLAGAQSKTAFYHDDAGNRWGIPTGRTPTTHIFKPPMPDFSGHTENEHFCLRLARRAGLRAAESKVLRFAGEKAIVVERYDRRRRNGRVLRIHQEDMCQALAVLPTDKYENQGGPGIIDIVNVLSAAGRHADTDRLRFVEATVFNFLIAGTDAHAKNYSVLLSSAGARLAPLYDVSSILPHLKTGEVKVAGGGAAGMRDIRLPMRISDVYAIDGVMPRHWQRMAAKARLSGDAVLGFARHHISTLPDLAADVARECDADGIDHPIVGLLVDCIAERANALKRFYGSEALPDGALPARPRKAATLNGMD